MSRATALKSLLDRPGIIVAPGVHDAITAKLAAKAGFEAGYVSGSGAVTSILAQPDVGLITLPEMAAHVRHISEATPVPLIVDADTGHGSVLNVMRCVREFELAGASAIISRTRSFQNAADIWTERPSFLLMRWPARFAPPLPRGPTSTSKSSQEPTPAPWKA